MFVYCLTVYLNLISANISFVIAATSYLGSHPHSFLATVSSIERGQESAIRCLKSPGSAYTISNLGKCLRISRSRSCGAKDMAVTLKTRVDHCLSSGQSRSWMVAWKIKIKNFKKEAVMFAFFSPSNNQACTSWAMMFAQTRNNPRTFPLRLLAWRCQQPNLSFLHQALQR